MSGKKSYEKNFFRDFFSKKATLDESQYQGGSMYFGDLNYQYLNVLEKYLFSYKWCRNETERQIFEQSLKGVVPNKMEIIVTKGDEKTILKKESIRSANSRLSSRMYSLIGKDCIDALLYAKDDPAKEERIRVLMGVCQRLNDNYVFQNHFSSTMQDLIQRKISPCKDVYVPRQFKIDDLNSEALSFFALYSNDSILKTLNSLDTKSVAIIYKVLTRPEYCSQRADVLKYFDDNVDFSFVGVSEELTKLREELAQVEAEKEELRMKFNRKLENAKYRFDALNKEIDKLKKENKILSDKVVPHPLG